MYSHRGRKKKNQVEKGILIKVFGGSFSHFNEDNNNYFRGKDIRVDGK